MNAGLGFEFIRNILTPNHTYPCTAPRLGLEFWGGGLSVVSHSVHCGVLAVTAQYPYGMPTYLDGKPEMSILTDLWRRRSATAKKVFSKAQPTSKAGYQRLGLRGLRA